MIERRDLDTLNNWKTRKNRKPLVLRGARQVGKTELVRMLGRSFNHFVEINFDEHPEKAGLFPTNDVLEGLRFLSIDIGEQIVPGETLLFLDEIQAAPNMLHHLRYFYEKIPALHVIAAGSLLEFLLAEHDFSMPVGRVEYHFLSPLSFEEFLGAVGEGELVEYLRTIELGDTVPDPIHQKCMRYVQYYSVIGGMPEAVNVWKEDENISDVQRIHAGIVQTYEDDFSKYRNRINPDYLRLVLKRIPSLIGQKLRYVNLDRNAAPSSLAAAIRALSKAGVIAQVFHSSGNAPPLGAEASEKTYKTLYLDVGLCSTALGLRLSDIRLTESFMMINRGALAEQFIGQQLIHATPSWIKPELYYWTRHKKGSSSEVDYIICVGPDVVPVEVKAGKTGTLRSLHTFAALKGTKLAVRFNADRPSLTEIETETSNIGIARYRLISLPLYMVEQAGRLLE